MPEHVCYLNHFKDVSKSFITQLDFTCLKRKSSLSSYHKDMQQSIQDSFREIFIFFQWLAIFLQRCNKQLEKIINETNLQLEIGTKFTVSFYESI